MFSDGEIILNNLEYFNSLEEGERQRVRRNYKKYPIEWVKAHDLKKGDTISIKGFGRFKFLDILGVTRKNKYKIKYLKYE